MTVEGSLKTMELAFLMQWCGNARKTGTLTLRRDSMSKELHFEGGAIVSAASNDPREYLGQFLVAMGKISEEELTLAFEVQRKTNILLGRILVARRLLAEKEVRGVLERKVMEMLFNLFLWKEGRFHFSEATVETVGRRVDVRVDPEKCILECARRVDEWKRFRAVFPHDRLVITRTGKKAPPFKEEPMKRQVLAFALEEMTIEGMCLELRTYSFALLGVLHDLHRAGLVTAAAAKKVKAADRKKGARTFKTEADEVRWLYEKGVSAGKVPALAISIAALKEISLTSQEAFVISRINGRWDVRSIVMICPIKEVETLRALKRFAEENIITLG